MLVNIAFPANVRRTGEILPIQIQLVLRAKTRRPTSQRGHGWTQCVRGMSGRRNVGIHGIERGETVIRAQMRVQGHDIPC